MFPRDALAPEAAPAAAVPVGASRRSRLRLLALVGPYVGILAGAIALARVHETYFERFWWLAPAAVVLYLCVLSVTVGSLARRRSLAREQAGQLAALEQLLRDAVRMLEASRSEELRRLISRLPEVRAASRSLSGREVRTLRDALVDLDASSIVEAGLRRSRRKWRRAEALFALGWLADERSIPVLREALHGYDPELAYVAGQALADYDSATACSCLVEALRTECIPRPLAATLLEGSRHQLWPDLVAGAGCDPSSQVRSWVAYLHGRTKAPGAARWLASLAADPEAEVRASAAEALGFHPNAEILDSLLGDRHWMVRANAAKAVGHAGLGSLAPRLAELLRDRTWWVRQSATLALKQLGASSVSVVRPMLADEDRFARNKAAEVLVDVGYVSAQIAALSGDGPSVLAARQVLIAIGHADAISLIEGSVEAQDPLTQERLRELLEEIRRPGAAACGQER